MSLTPDQHHSLDECRRMLGVLLGWRAPQGPEVAALTALRSSITPAALEAAVKGSARDIAEELAPLLAMLPDADIERIRDAAVEALELSKGTLVESTMRFSRVAQP